jgi:hypothetical protein
MWRCSVIAILLSLLPWAEPASAQKVYWLTVSIHKDVRHKLTQKDIEKIFKRESKLLKEDNACDVEFKLNGPVQTFTSAPAYINDLASLEAVHHVAADVKVVQEIKFCRGQYYEEGVIGCSWRPAGLRPKTVIVTTATVATDLRHILWAHEFGHTTGLEHRIDDSQALMTPCDLQSFNRHINEAECRCFVAGPDQCHMPDLNVACPAPSRRRGAADRPWD